MSEDVFIPQGTSVEKLSQTLSAIRDAPPADFQAATLMQALGMLEPLLHLALPDDPAELDEILATGAKWALLLRSDDAPAIETINQLFGL